MIRRRFCPLRLTNERLYEGYKARLRASAKMAEILHDTIIITGRFFFLYNLFSLPKSPQGVPTQAHVVSFCI